VRLCSRCGEENSDRARFCQVCGLPLEDTSQRPGESRKTVTVLFSDVVGSTSLGERLDPESLRRLMSTYFEAMRAVLGGHGGTVEKFIGDAIMSVFGIPQLHEDDALRAVRAAGEMRERLTELNADLAHEFGVEIVQRTGINTGEVVAGDPSAGQSLVTCDAVNTAARLEQAAAPGEVLIGDATFRLVRDAVVVEPVEPVQARGKAEPVPAHRLLTVIPGTEPHTRHLDAPMVGRERELDLILSAFDDVVAERACRLVTVLGEAGIGKSRLVLESLARLGSRALVLRGRCLPYGEGITYWPVAEAVREAASISDEQSPDEARRRIAALLPSDEGSDRVADHIAELVGLGRGSRVAEEAFWAVRRFIEALARTRPVVLVLDDIHWGEETFLDLLAYVLEWTSDVPVLLLCLARKDLLDRRPGWATSSAKARIVALEPLAETESSELLRRLLQVDEIPEPITAAITGTAAGNPLFVEELLSMLIDRGLLRRENGRWKATHLDEVSVPPTVQALLAARLEQLDTAERRVLEGAAVVGEVFDWGAASELVPADLRPGLGGHLMALVRKELIRSAPSDLAGEDAFRFRHILVRDAAYEAMPKERRAELHERFARWLERMAEGRLAGVQEIVGYHFERAYRYREQLGRVSTELAREAAHHLGEAGRRALARADVAAAANLLGRSVDLLTPADPSRPTMVLALIEALRELGEFERVGELADAGLEAARASGDRALELRFELVRLFLLVMVDPKRAVFHDIIGASLAIAAEAESLGDPLTQGEALIRAGRLLNDSGRTVEGERTGARAQECLDRAGVASVELAFLMSFSFSWQGPTPAPEAIALAERARERIDPGSPAEAFLNLGTAPHLSMRGEFEQARALVRRGASILQELGMTVELAATAGIVGAIVEMNAGEMRIAEDSVRPAYETLVAMGEKGRMSSRAALLARIVYEQGRYDEALVLADIADRVSADEDMEPQIWIHGVRAMVAARRGSADEAMRLARRAVELAEGTDWPEYQGTAWMAMTEVMRIIGRRKDAAESARTAAERFDAKGNVVMEARARAALAELGG
jgi:class 3 adenylate cyclase/tetratricopeptide (TPR) repeat protein